MPCSSMWTLCIISEHAKISLSCDHGLMLVGWFVCRKITEKVIDEFYRATRMHSADYAVARCLSVCSSVTRRYSVETAKTSIKVFHHRLYTQTILVFPYLTG